MTESHGAPSASAYYAHIYPPSTHSPHEQTDTTPDQRSQPSTASPQPPTADTNPKKKRDKSKGVPTGRTRSPIACNLCRKQKMKCLALPDAPAGSPCQRCTVNKTDCIYGRTESSQGKADLTTDSRLLQLEAKLMSFEALEVRVAALEAELSHYRTNVSSLVPLPVPPASDSSPSLVTLPSHHFSHPTSNGTLQPLYHPDSLSSGAGEFSPAAWPHSSVLRFENDDTAASSSSPHFSSSTRSNDAHSSDQPNTPRDAPTDPGNTPHFGIGEYVSPLQVEVKSMAARPDSVMIELGIDLSHMLGRDDCFRCFEGYFASVAISNPGHMSKCSEMFELVEHESPFLFATLVAVGARFLHRTQSYDVAFANSRRQADAIKIDAPLTNPPGEGEGRRELDEETKKRRMYDLKGLALLAAYGGLPELVERAMKLAVALELPLVFSKLADGKLKDDGEEAQLVEEARVFLMVCFLELCYTSSVRWALFAFSRFPAPAIHQCARILTQNRLSNGTDVVIELLTEALSISSRSLIAFSPPTVPTTHDESQPQPSAAVVVPDNTVLDGFLAELELWWNKWGQYMNDMTVRMNDHSRAGIGYHTGRFFIIDASFCVLPTAEQLANDPRRLASALDLIRSGQTVLDLAATSKIWHPHPPFSVHFQTMSLNTIPHRLVALSLLLPRPHMNLPSLRKTLLRTVKMLDRFTTGNATSTPLQRDQSARLLALVAKLDEAQAQMHVLGESQAREEAGKEDDEEEMGVNSVDMLIAEAHASSEVMSIDVAWWHQLLGDKFCA